MGFRRGFKALLSIKFLRVMIFSYISIIIPAYLRQLGFGPLQVGAVLFVIMAGNAASNLALLKVSQRLGERAILSIYSALIIASGSLLFVAGRDLPLIALAGFIGNISAGTETGPFQSIESSGLTRFAPEELKNRAYGLYNLMGFLATAIGASLVGAAGAFVSPAALYRGSLLLFSALGAILLAGYSYLKWPNVKRGPLKSVGGEKLREVYRLSALFFVDSFGGGFVTQSVLSYWFLIRFNLNLEQLGAVFFVVNLISSASVYLSSYLSDLIGNVRTMFYTHLISNVLLAMVALSPTLAPALAFLFLRQTVSQMDVPARQSLLAYMFGEDERVYAVAITNVFRSFGYVPGSYITGLLLALGYPFLSLLTAATVKAGYDVTFYAIYRNVERIGKGALAS